MQKQNLLLFLVCLHSPCQIGKKTVNTPSEKRETSVHLEMFLDGFFVNIMLLPNYKKCIRQQTWKNDFPKLMPLIFNNNVSTWFGILLDNDAVFERFLMRFYSKKKSYLEIMSCHSAK